MATRDILSTIPRRAVLAIGAGLILIVFSATAIVLAWLRDDTLQRTEQHLANLAVALEEQTRQSVRSIELATKATAEELQRRFAGTAKVSDAELFNRIGERMRTLSHVRVLAFIDARGDAVLHSNGYPTPAMNYSDREYFRAHRERRIDGLYIGEPVFGRLVPEWLNVFSCRVEDGRREFRGVVIAAVEVSYFQRVYESLNLGAGGRVFLFRDDGVLLTMHTSVESAVGRSFAGDPLFKVGLAAAASGIQRRNGIVDELPRVIAFRRVAGYPLVVTVSATEQSILGEWRRDAWRVGGGAAGTALIVGIAMFLLLRQQRVSEALSAEVRESDQRWCAAMEAAGHGIWDWDVSSAKVYRSPRYHAILGYSNDEIPAGNEGWLHLLHPDDRQRSHAANRACVDGTADSFSVELRLRRKDGNWTWILNRGMAIGRDERGRALRVLGTITDLTEHRQAQQQMQESESRLQGIIRSAMDAIITVDERQDIVMFNEAAEKIFRCPAAGAIGGPLARFIPERFRAAHHAHVERFGRTSETTRRMGARLDLWGLRTDGEEFPIDASISQVEADGKKYFTVILRDITERRAAEVALERSQGELRDLYQQMHEVREAERMRIARELHDELAQWLTALKMDVSWVGGRLPAADDRLQEKVERMKRLVDSTVTSVRRIAHDLRPSMLDDLGLVPAIEHLLHEFSERTGMIVELDANAAEVEFREPLSTAVYRMIQEGLTNVARHARATEVRVAVRVEGDDLIVSVRDNGVGIGAAQLNSGKSFGLLGIKERARTLGGAADIYSAQGGGATVEIKVPVTQYRGRGEHA